MAVCPVTVDTLHEQTIFNAAPGAQAVFHACTKHVLANDSWNFRILNPNNSVFDSWTYTSLLNRNTSILGWTRTLPTDPGIYTFEGTFNSITCTQQFTIQAPVGIENQADAAPISIYPNPTKDLIHFSLRSDAQLTNLAGQTISQEKATTTIDLSRQPAGIYFLTLTDVSGKVLREKIVKE
jgi:hypothetical protein